MATIIRNNQEIHFDRIVAYGCSYTAGAELSDYLAFPDISIDEVENLKRSISVPQFYIHLRESGIPQKELDAYNIAHAWPAFLSKMFNTDYLNRAKSGASNQFIVYAIERDLANLVIKETDLIVVGVTSFNRWFYLDNSAIPRVPLIGYYSEKEWPSREFYDNYLQYISGANDAYSWSSATRYLTLLSEKLGHRILLQPLISDGGWSDFKSLQIHNDMQKYGRDNANLIKHSLNNVESTPQREFMNTMKHLNNSSCIISKLNTFSKVTGHCFSEPWPISHAFGHPTQQQQEQFAEFIYKELTNE